ncbi:hypothetical protein [Hwangdonia lutea]|uniref:Outer membrane protein beta-barrel domain-containing protein n=1 Tax=Hwangdonia lutea TaxID=3075823 RepID=A0AA97ENG2_9FLAO|nr:hypothetical protein [Hwangdonia sp. SCSIO 19198]WOD44636.1 hypothetical protein RNZ46_05100 [Hwangdonia sp. SCSIO 19198]
MKKILFLLVLTTSYLSLSAQQQFTINGKNYELKTAAEGHLDLLWNTIDKQFRYFVKTSDGTISELLNTKNSNNNFNEEYKTQLKKLTENAPVSINNLKFTLSSLSQFVKQYNTAMGDLAQTDKKPTLKSRLGLYGGITNHPFVSNPNNTTVPFFGAELEITSSLKTSRHAGFFSVEHALDHTDFKYTSTQLALGYRYRFINKPGFNIYGNALLATYNFSKSTVEIIGLPHEVVKNSTFKTPFAFGLGADIKTGNTGFITLAYNNLFAVFVDSNKHFPVHFAAGYKFNL